MAAEELHLPDFYVEPLITPDSTTVVFGPREAGKTQFILSLFKAIQLEDALFGRYQCKKCKAVLVEVDMPLVQVQRRVRLAMQFFPYDASLFRVLDLRSLDLPRATPNDPWVQALREFDPQLIVFDSLRKCHSLAENDTASPSRVYGRTRELFPDAARMFAHHVGKAPGMVEAGASVRDDDESYRGTTAWLDDADTGILLQRKGNHRTFRVTRGRHADEDIKREIISLRFNEDSLLLEATDSGPVTELRNWLLSQDVATRKQAMTWLHEHQPGKTERTYRRLCSAVGL